MIVSARIGSEPFEGDEDGGDLYDVVAWKWKTESWKRKPRDAGQTRGLVEVVRTVRCP